MRPHDISKQKKAENENLFPTGLKPKVHLLSDMVKEFGWPKLLTEIVPWLVNRRYLFFSQKIEYPSNIPEAAIPFHLSRMDENDIEKILTLRTGFYDPDILRRRLREGHICFMGWAHDRPIHLRWVFIRSVYLPYLHRNLVLRPGEVYGNETYTLPQLRKHGILVRAGFLVRKYLKERGFRRILFAASSWDLYMQAYAGKMKFNKVGEGGYRNLFGKKKFYWQGGVKELGSKKISILSDE
ncbi:MAG: hypothetical protein PVI11_04900 [Candidatus Aminicenantes bacterium]|jgi:hypothetical protein